MMHKLLLSTYIYCIDIIHQLQKMSAPTNQTQGSFTIPTVVTNGYPALTIYHTVMHVQIHPSVTTYITTRTIVRIVLELCARRKLQQVRNNLEQVTLLGILQSNYLALRIWLYHSYILDALREQD